MNAALWVAFGSALGGVGRYWCSGLIAHRIGETFPWGTLVVNVVGSAAIGLVATLSAPEGRWLLPPEARGARLHTAKILRLADDLPLVLEIVDAAWSRSRGSPSLDPGRDG